MDTRPATERDCAARIGCSPACLRTWRRLGKGPRFFRAGRLIRYEESAIAEFIARNSSPLSGTDSTTAASAGVAS